MLCLTIKQDQAVWMKTAAGEEIRVLVIFAQDGKARLGVEAPQSVTIVREDAKNKGKPR